MKKIYAELSYGRISLAVLEVEDKPKSYKVLSEKLITGFYYGKTFKKDDEHLHDSLNDAFLYLEKVSKEVMEVRKKDYEDALSNYQDLSEIVERINKYPQSPEKAIKELLPRINL